MRPTAELLRRDKEKLLAALGAAGSPERAVPVLEKEIDRILLAAEADTEETEGGAALSRMLRVLRMSARFADSAGEVEVWEREKRRSSFDWKSVALLAAGIAFLVSSLIIAELMGISLTKAAVFPALLALLMVGAALLFAAGFLGGRGKKAAHKENTRYEVKADPEQLFRCLSAALSVADQCAQEAAGEEAYAKRQRNPTDAAAPGDMELQLFAGLLEAAYSGDAAYMQAKIGELRYYLHTRHIEVVDCTEETRSYFDQMPSSREGTLRPALVADGRVLKRGLAHEPLLRI